MLNYYYYLFIYFQILVKFFFWEFSFCLKVEQIMEQNFIGIKKIEGVPIFFLLYIIFFPGHGSLGTTLPLTWRNH